MKLPVRLTLVYILATLLIACDSNKGTNEAPSSPVATAEPVTPIAVDTQTPLPAPGQFTIDLTPGNVSVRANQVNERELLEHIAAMANFELLTDKLQWNTITVDIHTNNLHAALTELIRAYPYQIVYTPDKDTQQEILSAIFISEDLPPVTAANPNKTITEDSALPDKEEEEELPDLETLAQLKALQNESAEIRAAAVEDIEAEGEALITLTKLITSDPSPEVRIATAQALEFSDDPLAIQALVACLKDEFPVVLVECIKALEHIGDSSNATQLQPLLEHYDPAVRDTAAQAIEGLQ